MNRASLLFTAFSLTTVSLLAVTACDVVHGRHRGFDDDDDEDERDPRNSKACREARAHGRRYPPGHDPCARIGRPDATTVACKDAGTSSSPDTGTAARDSGGGGSEDSGSGSAADSGRALDSGSGGGADAGTGAACTDSATCPSGQQCSSRTCQPCARGICACQRDNDCPRGEICNHQMGVCGAAPPTCADLRTEPACAARADCRPIYAGMHCTNDRGSECHSGEANCTCATYEFAVCANRL